MIYNQENNGFDPHADAMASHAGEPVDNDAPKRDHTRLRNQNKGNENA